MSKRYNLRLSDCELIGYGVDTKVKLEYKFSDTLGETRVVSLDDVNDLLNEQEQRIQELEEENTQLCNFNLHIILDKKNKEINQLKKELRVWKDTAESLECQLAHKIDEVLSDD